MRDSNEVYKAKLIELIKERDRMNRIIDKGLVYCEKNGIQIEKEEIK